MLWRWFFYFYFYFLPIFPTYASLSVKSSLLLSAGIVPSLTESGVKNSSLCSGENLLTFQWGSWPFRSVKFTANPRPVLLDPNKSKLSKHAYKNIMHFNTLYRKHIVFVNLCITIIVNIQLLCSNMVWTSAWHFLQFLGKPMNKKQITWLFCNIYWSYFVFFNDKWSNISHYISANVFTFQFP